MSTNSTISVKIGETIKTIYCHYDGYESHHMPILKEHYNTQKLAEKLIDLGDLSILDKSTDCPEGHTFNNPIEGYCLAYIRDRKENENKNKARTFFSMTHVKIEMGIMYNYYFDGEKWELFFN